MDTIDFIIAIIIGIIVLFIVVAFMSGKFAKTDKMGDDLINKTLEDPFSIVASSIHEQNSKSYVVLNLPFSISLSHSYKSYNQ